VFYFLSLFYDFHFLISRRILYVFFVEKTSLSLSYKNYTHIYKSVNLYIDANHRNIIIINAIIFKPSHFI